MNLWHDLLVSPNGKEASLRRFTILQKRGLSFLYLPEDRRLVDATLRLYPAQTWFARMLVWIVNQMIRIRFPVSFRKLTISVSQYSAFGAFLKSMVPDSNDVPPFGVLSGNMKTPGRRYTLLLFDAACQPRVVVKVGITPKAQQLIQVEQNFFFQQRPQLPGLPEALAVYQGTDAQAIAYRYVEGMPPLQQQQEGIGALMNSWISDGEPVPLSNLSTWTALEVIRKENPELESVFQILQKTPVRPVLCHGDFAPWNIRISPSAQEGNWVALDWERNCANGIPGWDWFHYIIQYNTMVRHTRPEKTLSDLETLWANPTFLSYARRTGIEKILKELTLVYFLHLLRYFAPRDHTAEAHLLVEKFRQRYFKDFAFSRPALKVSVVTPSYKQLPWLKLCIASVADQQGVSVEHIIQDAQSGPELEQWVRKNSKAHLYVEADSGMYDAIDRGFARATGDIVCWLNSDEQYLEGTLQKVVRYFENHPEVDVLFGDALLIGNTGTLLSYRRTIFPNLKHIQLSHLNVLSCATFIRRSVLERGHWLDIRWKAIADAVWVVDLLKAEIPMAILNEPLSVFTITDKNLGQTSLALAETERWQQETLSGKRWLRSGFVWWHRLNKFFGGAYWPRSINTRLYTLSSPNERVTRSASFLGFNWPRST